MNTYDKFKIELFVENLNSSEFLEVENLFENIDLETLNEDELNEFKNIIKKTVSRIGKSIKGKVTRRKKKDVSGVKTLKSDGKGGVTRQSAVATAKRSRLSKKIQRVMTGSKRKLSALKGKFTSKTKGTKA